MRAVQIVKEGQLELVNTELKSLPSGWHEVEIICSGLNRRDYWITKGLYPGLKYPCTLGSDAVGLLDGARMIINPGLGWEENSPVQPSGFQILGMPLDGTLAEKIVLPESSLFICPNHLSNEEAGVLGLAGLTAFRALFTKGKLTTSDTVLISGVGGGVATMALQFALAAGATTFVSSGSDEKIQKAIALGAAGGFRYDKGENDSIKRESNGFDLIIDSAVGEGFSDLVDLLNPGGRIVFYGGTRGDMPVLNSRKLFWKQISILGTTMGSRVEFAEMLAFINKHKISPVVDAVYSIEDYEEAFCRLEKSDQFGKIAISIKS